MSKRALLSVYDKKDIVEFAKTLQALGFSIVSSGGTARKLKEGGVENVTDVAEITGCPAILNHRVVTLHPKIHGGILAEKTDEHEAELRKHDIPRFDLVCVDVYPVWEALAKPGATMEQVVELTDIGGPTMLRGAAKNHQNVIVICDPADRQRVLDELRTSGDVNTEMRRELAQKVFDLMARYDASIRQFFAAQNDQVVENIFMGPARELAYAQNRYQNPSHLFPMKTDDPLVMHRFEVVSGDPSFISIADGSRILDVLCLLVEAFRQNFSGRVPCIVIAGKHGNPCGAAFDWGNPMVALRKALYGDTVAVMGGEVITNFPITDELGQELMSPSRQDIGRKNWGLDIILAPLFSSQTIDLLGKREKRRLLSNPALAAPQMPPDEWVWRPVRGGWLRERAPWFILTHSSIEKWIDLLLPANNFATLLVAWAVCWRATSNTVALAKDGMLIALGCGQQDRIACVRLCLDRARRAGHNPKGSVFASDAFFPYALSQSIWPMKIIRRALGRLWPRLDNREGPELLVHAGCKGGVVPADGKNLKDVQAFFRKASLSVAFVNKEHRGFAEH